ncbi:MAP kinase-activated protein kinase 2 (Fragment) [Seminavis robusta]|uniref:non-specific serine/threonine protein kinase n=1 Tax=Seminavis robusta TaxID=568900 RepID=A0A9N8HP71_9STRA
MTAKTTSFSVHDLCTPHTGREGTLRSSSTDVFTFSAKDFVKERIDTPISDVYEIGERLGAGGYGEVFACVHKETKIERAVKILDRSRLSPFGVADEDELIKEFNILKELDHPNILKQIEMFSDEKNYYIVTEICRGGELFDEIQEWGNFIEEDAAELMRHLLGSINYCHQKGVVHRDLKPENILLEQDKDLDSIKVIDFGLAQCVEKDTEMTDLVGSIYYIAPEVLMGRHNFKADIWSCGVIAYVLLAGYAPFDGHSDEEIKEEILSGEFEFDEDVWEDVSEQAKDFICTLLEFDAKERVTADEALKHPWIVQSRIDASERIKHRDSANERAMEALYNLERFNAQNKLKQATCAFIASQLVLKEEKKRIDELFRALDINNNGKLSKEDVQTGYKEVFGKELNPAMVEAMFKRIDYDNTGYIEYSEFLVATMNEKDLLNNDKLKHAFNMFDADGSGVISRDELVEVMSYFQSVDKTMNGEAINRIIRQVDESGDGQIDFEEFKAMMVKTADDTGISEDSFSADLAALPIPEPVPEPQQETPQPPQGRRTRNMPAGLSSSCTTAPKSRLPQGPPSALSSSVHHGRDPLATKLSGGTKKCLALFERTPSEGVDQFVAIERLSCRLSFGRMKRRDSQEIIRMPKNGSLCGNSQHSNGSGGLRNSSRHSGEHSLRESQHSLRGSMHRPRTGRAKAAVFRELVKRSDTPVGAAPHLKAYGLGR